MWQRGFITLFQPWSCITILSFFAGTFAFPIVSINKAAHVQQLMRCAWGSSECSYILPSKKAYKKKTLEFPLHRHLNFHQTFFLSCNIGDSFFGLFCNYTLLYRKAQSSTLPQRKDLLLSYRLCSTASPWVFLSKTQRGQQQGATKG